MQTIALPWFNTSSALSPYYADVSIRQHTSAYVSIRAGALSPYYGYIKRIPTLNIPIILHILRYIKVLYSLLFS